MTLGLHVLSIGAGVGDGLEGPGKLGRGGLGPDFANVVKGDRKGYCDGRDQDGVDYSAGPDRTKMKSVVVDQRPEEQDVLQRSG